MGRYSDLSEETKRAIDLAKEDGRLTYEAKQDELAKIRSQIHKAGLSYRYFRNIKTYRKRNVDHGGVICVGYKIVKDDAKGINFTMCVAFCSPKDSFSRFEAKKHLARRYLNNETVNITATYGSEKEIIHIIKGIWNSQKLPLEKLGIKSPAEGREIKLKPWMKFIR